MAGNAFEDLIKIYKYTNFISKVEFYLLDPAPKPLGSNSNTFKICSPPQPSISRYPFFPTNHQIPRRKFCPRCTSQTIFKTLPLVSVGVCESCRGCAEGVSCCCDDFSENDPLDPSYLYCPCMAGIASEVTENEYTTLTCVPGNECIGEP